MSGHTPGPWHDDGYRIYAPTTSADPRDGRIIMEYKHTYLFNPADAPLIKAAPVLLAALQKAIDLFPLGVGAVSTSEFTKANSDRCIEEARGVMAEVRAAIASATGKGGQ